MTDHRNPTDLYGLTQKQAEQLLKQFGRNELVPLKKETFFHKVLHVLREPMFLLLIAAAIIYFILGEAKDGSIMLIFVLGIIAIDVIQEWKTDKTLNALKELSAPHSTVIREGRQQQINSVDLVPDDIMLISEGVKIPADGKIIISSDLCVDESSLTGESEGVWKNAASKEEEDGYWRKDTCYAGTLVIQGSAAILVTKTGPNTEYGKIGLHVASAPDRPTPLEKQTRKLVTFCVLLAAMLFILVSLFTYFNIPEYPFKDRVIESILSGITLSMAMIPEEFPVILTVFLSMGAWRLAQKNSLVRKLSAVETLGAVSVLCVDKTGTITENQMKVQDIWTPHCTNEHFCEIMGLGCEVNAYDPMEKAMMAYCESLHITKETLSQGELIYEYAFTNQLKMMGHVWKQENQIVIAAKGSPERILTLCSLTETEREQINQKISQMAQMGLRVIAVGEMVQSDKADIPKNLSDCTLVFCGIVGLADPPRKSVMQDIKSCTKAGVRVVMITGDSAITASAIASQVNIPHSDQVVTGDELNDLTDDELKEKVKTVNIFSRVIPEHKMRIVKALKENGEVVAMTGDGVNDAPALKYADIGIAMGKRGSQVSKEAADLILLDDNFSTIVDTIRNGRRIYDNIRKAIGYVFAIHIPIALSSLIAPLMHISPSSLFILPLHVMLLELVIDPTCSVVLERQPEEHDIMERPPRNPKEKILTSKALAKSLIQGFVIFAASFGTYYMFLTGETGNAMQARSMGLTILIISNLFLVSVISSDFDSALKTLWRLRKDKILWAINIFSIFGLFLILYTPLNEFLKLTPLSTNQLLSAVGISLLAVYWYEVLKLIHRRKIKNSRL